MAIAMMVSIKLIVIRSDISWFPSVLFFGLLLTLLESSVHTQLLALFLLCAALAILLILFSWLLSFYWLGVSELNGCQFVFVCAVQVCFFTLAGCNDQINV